MAGFAVVAVAAAVEDTTRVAEDMSVVGSQADDGVAEAYYSDSDDR